ncbi:MAG: dienelactone hydrolase family protein [Betaproteobacteria bacterium]|nr:dienelactone hydrolase family protein [Betaproteobacteria bacterium]
MLSRLKILSWSLFLLASCASSASHEADWVEFPALKEFAGGPVRLEALMFRPRGAGPFPALVLLHGCGGMYTNQGYVTASYRYWLELLSTQGYVALLVDSFNPRGQRSICDQQKRTILQSRERVEDAYAALQWLNQQPFAASGRIGLLGWSNGASGTLYSLRPTSRIKPGFRAAVAFYPGCRALSRATPPYQPYAPLLILIGEADDWTPAAPCRQLADTARSNGAPMEIVTYPGAHHSFDRINSPVRYRPNVRNPNQPGGRGATVGEHPEAREDAIRRALEFFAKTLKN